MCVMRKIRQEVISEERSEEDERMSVVEWWRSAIWAEEWPL